MSAEDLVVRLQATLDEVEKPALDDVINGYVRWTVDPTVPTVFPVIVAECLACEWSTRGPESDVDSRVVEHVRQCQPNPVLRLVQSHRDLIAEWRQQAQIRDLLDEPDQKQSDAYLTAVGITAGLWAAVTIVARGYGIEDSE